MAMMGHRTSAMALDVYARKLDRDRDTGARLDALIKGPERTQMGMATRWMKRSQH
jgi:hypothetical protein